jgi:hypothetical protein
MNFPGFPVTTLVFSMPTIGELLDGNGGLLATGDDPGGGTQQAITSPGGTNITSPGLTPILPG